MRLVHIDLNQRQSDVEVGFQFDHDGKIWEVNYMPVPHKPSSGGKVTCNAVDDDDRCAEYFANVWSMKWIEREDQGWIHPDVELTNVCAMYEEMYDDSIIGLDLVSVIDMLGQVDMDHLRHYPTYADPILDWLEKNRVPMFLIKQSD